MRRSMAHHMGERTIRSYLGRPPGWSVWLLDQQFIPGRLWGLDASTERPRSVDIDYAFASPDPWICRYAVGSFGDSHASFQDNLREDLSKEG